MSGVKSILEDMARRLAAIEEDIETLKKKTTRLEKEGAKREFTLQGCERELDRLADEIDSREFQVEDD